MFGDSLLIKLVKFLDSPAESIQYIDVEFFVFFCGAVKFNNLNSLRWNTAFDVVCYHLLKGKELQNLLKAQTTGFYDVIVVWMVFQEQSEARNSSIWVKDCVPL